jgi:hypothetical protein
MTVRNLRVGVAVVALLVAAASDPGAQAVKPAPLRVTAEPITNWGSTFHALEQKAHRVTSRFDDGYAVAERSPNGHIRTWLYTRAGNEIGTLDSEPTGSLRFDALGSPRVNTVRRAEVIPTLSWAGDQAYALSKSGGTAQWYGETLRGKREVVAREIDVEFEGNLTAKTKRFPNYYLTFLHRDGKQVGWVRYHPRERQLVFQFPGLVQDVIDQSALKPIGGWPFTPTMGWMHVQALAFYQFHSESKAKQRAAVKPAWMLKPELNWFQKAWETLVPVVHAQDGCTGLHRLDDTILRPCCDHHDWCYIRNGCDRSSWYWPFGNAWQCTPCNIVAVWCFLGTGHTTDGYVWHPNP